MRDEIMRLAERFEAMHARGDIWVTTIAAAAMCRALARTDHVEDKLGMVAEGFASVPRDPTPGVLMSMAIRYDHALRCPGYYDQPIFGAENIGHQKRLESTLRKMRQLYEEAVGAGFYSAEKEQSYAALAATPAPDHSAGVGEMVPAAPYMESGLDDDEPAEVTIRRIRNEWEGEGAITEKLTTPPERVQIPAESENAVPYTPPDGKIACPIPTCRAELLPGQSCGGKDCGLRREK